MLMDAHYDDPVLVMGRILAIATLVVAPWGIVRVRTPLALRCLWSMWFLGIFFLAALYLGFLTYHYMGPQLGFSTDGNPMNGWMIMLGFFSVMPFLLAARKGSIERPLRFGTAVALGVLLLVGPPVLNAVALNIYTQGGGGFDLDMDNGDQPGEVITPNDPEAWDFANSIGFVVCSLIPLLLFIATWRLGGRSQSSRVQIYEQESKRE